MLTDLKEVHLVYENCDVAILKPHDILAIEVSDVKKYAFVNRAGQFYTGHEAGKVVIVLPFQAMSRKTEWGKEGVCDETVGTMKGTITQIQIYGKNDKFVDVIVPWNEDLWVNECENWTYDEHHHAVKVTIQKE